MMVRDAIMKDGMNGWWAMAAVFVAFGVGACGADSKQSPGGAGQSTGGASQGAGGAGQSAGGVDPSVGAAGGDLGVAGPSEDCTFEIATSGAQVFTYAPALVGCTTIGQPGLYALFVREDLWQTEFRAPDFLEGQTGVPLPASFQIGRFDSGAWATGEMGCTVEISEQKLLGPAPYPATHSKGRQYRITGHGSCAEPAVDRTGTTSDLIPGPFSFRARKSFYD
jgi:hypothetical protein